LSIYTLVLQTLIASPSGALSPGPLTFATIALGVNGGWRKGAYVALGHMSFELPYVALIAFAMNTIRDVLSSFIGDIITVAGVGVLMFFAMSLIRESLSNPNVSARNIGVKGTSNAFAIGFLFTSLNIFFLLWWLSVGFGLILLALEIGFIGIIIMFFSHIWMDFLWLSLIAEAGKRGIALIGRKGYRAMLLVFGILLLFLGINILLKRFASISLL
jgi:threonine/homoserine/homoserine lactone efflux protein